MSVELQKLYDSLDNVEKITGGESLKLDQLFERINEIRNYSIYCRYLEGKKQSEVATEFGLSCARVNQIVRNESSRKFKKINF